METKSLRVSKGFLENPLLTPTKPYHPFLTLKHSVYAGDQWVI